MLQVATSSSYLTGGARNFRTCWSFCRLSPWKALLLWLIFLYQTTELNDFSGSFPLGYNVELLSLVFKKLISHINLIRNLILSL